LNSPETLWNKEFRDFLREGKVSNEASEQTKFAQDAEEASAPTTKRRSRGVGGAKHEASRKRKGKVSNEANLKIMDK